MCLESIIHVYCCKCLNIWQIIGLQGRKGLGPFLFALWVKILKLSEVSKETEVKHFFFHLGRFVGVMSWVLKGTSSEWIRTQLRAPWVQPAPIIYAIPWTCNVLLFFFFFILKRPKRDASNRNILFKSTLIQVIYLKKSTT